MGLLDRELLDAWWEVRGLLMSTGAGRVEALRRFDCFARSQLSAPLRSWALVLRASDGRIEGVGEEGTEGPSHRGIEGWGRDGGTEVQRGEGVGEVGGYDGVTGELVLTRSVLEGLCRPVEIGWPGVRVDEAAGMLGVSRQTIWRWFEKARNGRRGKARNEEGGKGPRSTPSSPKSVV